jgi:hypothetical protein
MRLLALTLLLIPAIPAQNFTGQIKMKSLVPPISEPWKSQQSELMMKLAEARKLAEAPKTCSIPVLVVPPKDVDSRMMIQPPATGFATRVVTPPAPPCSKTQQ